MKSYLQRVLMFFATFVAFFLTWQASAQTTLLSLDGAQFQTKTSGDPLGTDWALWTNGSIENSLAFPSSATFTFQIQAYGQVAANVWPQMQLLLDQKVIQTYAVNSTSAQTFTASVPVSAGSHKIGISFTNNYYANGEDRNLYIKHLNVLTATTAPAPTPAPAPTYSLSISSPAANATVSGSVQIKGTGSGFKNVEILKADGSLLARATPDASGNFAASVDSTKLSNGSQTLTIDAWDAPAGQSFSHSDEKKLTVNVQNGTAPAPTPTPAPAPAPSPAPTPTYTLSITSPAANATVSGTMSLKGTGPGLKNVEIFSSTGTLLARTTPDSSGAFTASIDTTDTTKFNNGSQTLTIDAWDAPAGQSFTHSDEKKLTVNVQNAAAQQTQALQLATPNLSAQAGSSLSFTTQFNAVPMDKSYVVFVHFVNSSGANAFGADYSPSPATTQWSGLVTSQRTVTVPSNLAAGTYSVRVGLYENVAPYTNRAKLALGPGVTQDNENRYIVGTLTVTAPNSNPSPTPPSGSTQLRIMFIGNSLTGVDNMPAELKHLAESKGYTPYIEEYIAFGMGLDYQLGRQDIKAALANKKWDYVVLQEFSDRPLTDPDSFRQSVVSFNQLIKQNGARTVLFENWPYKGANTLSSLNAIYADVANQVGALIAPLAKAWDDVNHNSSVNLYSDEKHPTPIASYMGACMFYKLFYGQSPVGLTHEGSQQDTPDNFGGLVPSQPFVNLDSSVGNSTVNYIQQTAQKY